VSFVLYIIIGETEQMGGEIVEYMLSIIKPETMVVGKFRSFSTKTCTVMPIKVMLWPEVMRCHEEEEESYSHPYLALTACKGCTPSCPYMYYVGGMLYEHALYIKILFNSRYIKSLYFH